MPHPNPPEPTPAAHQAAAGQRRGRPRRPRPGPPGFTIEVQVLGGEAGRRLDQEQTEAVAAVLAWLAAHPPTRTAAAGSAAIGTPVGQPTATATGMRPARPSPAGSRMPARRGRAAPGRADPQAEPAGPLQRAGRPGGWRVVVGLCLLIPVRTSAHAQTGFHRTLPQPLIALLLAALLTTSVLTTPGDQSA